MAGSRKAPAEEPIGERLEREQEPSSEGAEANAQAGGEPDAGGPAGSAENDGGGVAGRAGRQEAEAPRQPGADAGSGDSAAGVGGEPAPEPEAEPEDPLALEPEDPLALEPEDPLALEPEDPLALAQRERDQYLALAQRTQADFENWRKRASKEAAAASQRARSGLAGELLSVVDNLERALESASAGEEHLAGGVRLVHSELTSVLGRNGIEPFDPSGEKFDPALHEALATRAEEGSEPGVVLDVVEKGYRLADSVLRPARVVVSA